MKFNVKVKSPKYIPKVGDRRERTRFAVFPRKIGNQIVWFEKYIAIQEYIEFIYQSEEVVSEGIFTETYRKTYETGYRWSTIDKKLIK